MRGSSLTTFGEYDAASPGTMPIFWVALLAQKVINDREEKHAFDNSVQSYPESSTIGCGTGMTGTTPDTRSGPGCASTGNRPFCSPANLP
jgi:hypothetical protein